MMTQKHIGKEVKQLANLITRYIENTTNFQQANRATGANTWIIAYLARHADEDVFQKDLEREFSVTRSTASKVIRLMEQKGLIERESVSYDARLKKLILTTKAIELHRSIVAELKKLEQKLTQNLSAEEMNSFLDTIEKLKNNMKEQGSD
jgi:DNA-binding MarR family transcriptional regulator